MLHAMTADEKRDILARGFSRRSFGRFASLLTAGASLPFYNEFALAQSAQKELREAMPPDAVRISGNENPLGPCPEAREAVYNVAGQAGRYDPNGEYAQMIKTAAAIEGVKPSYVVAYAGSADPLHRTICAFVSPTRSLVTADPGYEAPERAAEFLGAKVIRVPLRKDFSHDVKAMVKADPNAGVIYICNPNNPTGTLTSKADVEWVIANKPKGTILLLDEAYIHFSSATPGSELVAADKEIVVLRTFSKAYGMAGLRAGMSLARPDLLEKMAPYASGRVPVTAAAAATASMKVKTLMTDRRSINGRIREDTFNFLEQKNFKFVRSESNFLLLDVKQPGKDFAAKMAKEKVFVGRTWPSMPTYSRITVGTEDDMTKFKSALMKVMA
jgi:histidinol-phosphate aminotransferase